MAKSYSEYLQQNPNKAPRTQNPGASGLSYSQIVNNGLRGSLDNGSAYRQQMAAQRAAEQRDAEIQRYLRGYYNALGTHYNNVTADNGQKVTKNNGIYESGKVLENYQNQSGDIMNTIRNAYGNDSKVLDAVRSLNTANTDLTQAVRDYAAESSRYRMSQMGENPLADVQERIDRGDRLSREDIALLDENVSRRAGIPMDEPQQEQIVLNPLSGKDGVLEVARQIREADDRTPLERLRGETVDTTGITDTTIPGMESYEDRFGGNVPRQLTESLGVSQIQQNIAESGIRSESELTMGSADNELAEKLFGRIDSVYRDASASDDDLRFQQDIALGISRNSANDEWTRSMAREYYDLIESRLESTDAASYLTRRAADAMVDWANNYQNLADLSLGDASTGGSYSEGFQTLTQYAQSHPATYRAAMSAYVGGDRSSAQELADATGVSVSVVRAWQKANEAGFMEYQADTAASGLSPWFKENIGDTVYHTASQIPSWALSAVLGGWPGLASGPSSVVDGIATGIQAARNATTVSAAASGFASAVGRGMLNAAAADPALWFSFGIGTMGRTVSQNAMERGYDPRNYLNGALMGFSEVFSENFSGFGTGNNPFTALTTPKGSRFLSVLTAMGNYLLTGAEEGLEELINVPMQNAFDNLTYGGKKLVGTGGIFDFQAMWDAGVSGAVMGAMLGSVGTLTNIATDILSDSTAVGSTAYIRDVVNNILNKPEFLSLEDGTTLDALDPRTADRDTILARVGELLEHKQTAMLQAVGESYIRSASLDELYNLADQMGADVQVLVEQARAQGSAVTPELVGEIALEVKGSEETSEAALPTIQPTVYTQELQRAVDNAVENLERIYAQDREDGVLAYASNELTPAARQALDASYESYKVESANQNVALEDQMDARNYANVFSAAYGLGRAYGNAVGGLERARQQLGNYNFVDTAYRIGSAETVDRQTARLIDRGGSGNVRSATASEIQKYIGNGASVVAGALGERQQAEIAVLNKWAQVAGYKFRLYHSTSESTPHGFYDRRTGTIYVDVNAGSLGERSILRVAAHEMTHDMMQRAPKQYSALKTFILNRYMDGKQDVLDARIREEMELAEKNGRELTTEQAADEVIANACEMMIRDSEAPAALYAADKNLAHRVLDWLRKFVSEIKKAFTGVDAESAAANDMREYWSDIQKLWDNGIKEAARWEIQQAAEVVEDGATENVQFSARDNGNNLDEATVRAALEDALDHPDSGGENVIRVGEIPNSYRIDYSARNRTITDTDIAANLSNYRTVPENIQKDIREIRRGVQIIADQNAYIEQQEQKLREAEQAGKSGAAYRNNIKNAQSLVRTWQNTIENTLMKSEVSSFVKGEREKIEGLLQSDPRRAVEYVASRYDERLVNTMAKYGQARRSFAEYITARNERQSAAKLRKSVLNRIKDLTTKLTQNTDKKHVPEALKGFLGDFLSMLDPITARRGTQREAAQVKSWNEVRDLISSASSRWQTSLAELSVVAARQNGDNIEDQLGFPPDLVEDIQRLSEDLNDIVTRLRDGNLTDEEKTLQAALGEMDARNALTNRERDAIRAEYGVDRLSGGDLTIRSMNSEQLTDLNRVLRAVQAVVNNGNRLFQNARYERTETMVQDSLAYLKSLNNSPFLVNKSGVSQAENRIEKFLNWDNAVPYYVFERFGDVGKSLFMELAKGWDEMAVLISEIQKFKEENFADNKRIDGKTIKQLSSDSNRITLNIEGQERSLVFTTADLMSFWAHSRRSQSLLHMTGAGIRIAYNKKNGDDASIYKLTPENIRQINGYFEEKHPEARALAEKMQDFMTKRGAAWGNFVSQKRFGYDFFNPYELYMPIQTLNSSRAVNVQLAQSADFFRLINMSATKPTTNYAQNALVVGNMFDVFTDHMVDMAKYRGMALPILDVTKWLNGYGETRDDSVQHELERAFGSVGPEGARHSVAVQYLTNLLRDLNGVHEGGADYTQLSGRLLSYYKRAAVSANLRVAMQQPLSISRAAVVIDTKYLTKALAQSAAPGVLKSNIQDGLEHSGTFKWKDMGFFDMSVAASLRDQIKGTESAIDKILDKSMVLAEIGDRNTWGVMWLACKLKVQNENPGLRGNAFYEAVNNQFINVIYGSQVMDGTLTRSQVMRSQNPFVKEMTAFKAEPTLTYNVVMAAANDVRNSKRRGLPARQAVKRLGIALACVAMSKLLQALVTAIADAFRDDDDYETFVEKYLEHFRQNLADEMNPLNDIVGVSYIWDAFQSLVKGKSAGEWSWLSGIRDAVQAFRIWDETIKVANGAKPTEVTSYGRLTPWGKIYKTLQAVSRLVGLPAANFTRLGVEMWNGVATVYNDLIAPQNGEYLNRVSTYDSEYHGYESLLEAEIKGNETRADSIYQEMLSNDLTDDQIRKGMRSQVHDAFYSGEITSTKAVYLLSKYGYSADDASSLVQTWQFRIDSGISDASEKMATEYENTFSKYGIQMQQFAEWYRSITNAQSQGNMERRDVIRNYINSLPISENVKADLWALEYSTPW